MEVTRENLLTFIRSGLKRESLSIAGLEKRSGVPKDTVRDFLRAKTQILRADKLQKILQVLEPEQKTTVTGYLGQNAEIFFADESGYENVECPPGIDPSLVVAVRIKGEAMSPVLYDGWIVYYSTQHDIIPPVIRGGFQVPYNKQGKKAPKKSADKRALESADPLSEFLGKPCVMKLKDGRTMLRILKLGTTPGHYTLVSFNAKNIENARLEWVAKIVFIKTQ